MTLLSPVADFLATRPRLHALARAQAPAWVAAPTGLPALRDALRQALAEHLALWPLGHARHAQLPATIARPWAALSTAGLADVVEIDVRSALVRVGAGCRLAALEEALAPRGLTMSHLGPLDGEASVGGLLAQPQGPSPVFFCPDIRGVCAGLTALAGPDALYRYLPAPRKAAGSDLRWFFLGAAGRSGVIVDAWLSAARLPTSTAVRSFRLASVEAAMTLSAALLAAGIRPWGLVISTTARETTLDVTLCGETILVVGWTQALERLSEQCGAEKGEPPDRPGDDRLAGITPEMEAFGGHGALAALAAQATECGGHAIIDRITPYSGRVRVRDVAPEPGTVPLDAWSVAGEVPTNPEPGDTVTRRVLQAAAPPGLWLPATWYDNAGMAS